MKRSAFKSTASPNTTYMLLTVLVMTFISLTMTTRSFAFAELGAKVSIHQAPVQNPSQTEVRELKMGEPVERELAGGDSHSYRVRLTAGQYLRVVVEQKGIDVVVRVFGPDSKQITEVDSPNGTRGPEPVSVIAEAGGDYRLEVSALDAKAAPGRYESKLEELRESTAKDRDRIAAALALAGAIAEADQLRAKGTAESLRKAVERYDEVLSLVREIEDRRREAFILNSIGTIYWHTSENRKALEYYNQALLIFRALGDRRQEASLLNNLGSVYHQLGEIQKALDYYNQALPILHAVADRQEEASTLSNVGVGHLALDDNQKALEYLKQALSLWQEVGDRRGEAITLSNIGGVYERLGDLQKALEYYNQSLPLSRAAGHRKQEATTLGKIGATYNKFREFQKALQYLAQSLALSRAVGDRRQESYALKSIGFTHQRLGETNKALNYYNQSLSLLRAVGDRRGETNSLNNIGDSYINLGEPQKALEYHLQALKLSRDVGNQVDEAASLYGISRAQSKLGVSQQARTHIEAALNLIESTRSKVADQELRASFLASNQDFYEFYIDLLMTLHRRQPSAGYDAAALQASERARARSLLEMLTEARADIRQGIDFVLLERERSSQQQLNTKSERLTRLLSGKHTEEQEAAARKEVEAILADYQNAQAEIRAKSPRYAALTQPQPLALKEIQQLLDKDTLLLEYALGEERSYVWAVTPTSIKSFELPKRAEIETAAQRFYKLVTTNENRILEPQAEAAAALSQLLLEPVASELGQKRLVIVSDGALQYVPFATFPVPNRRSRNLSTGASKKLSRLGYQPLIIRHEIVQLPSASVLGSLRKENVGRTPATKMVAVLADPVFHRADPRVKHDKVAVADKNLGAGSVESDETRLETEVKRSAWESGVQDLQRLPFSRTEAETIVALAPRGQSLKALDFDASRATITSGKVGDYRIVHFATHGLLNTVHPELSGVVLSLVDQEGRPQNGFLRLHEIYNLKLPADLVVLSGCQTALGKQVKGEGLVGLTRGFMYAGAPRVVVSLWDVTDEATAELMERFYEGLLKKGMRPATALREAQLSMWRSQWWGAPYFWAGFVIQGEWR